MAPYNGRQVCEIRELPDGTWLIYINNAPTASASSLAEAKANLPENIHLTIYSIPTGATDASLDEGDQQARRRVACAT